MLLMFSFLAGFILDVLFGEIPLLVHPVQVIGILINKTEHFLRTHFHESNQKLVWLGSLLAIIVILCSVLFPSVVLYIAWRLNKLLFYTLQAWMFYRMLAIKSLKKESMKVYDALKNEGLVAARKAVGMIVGRDTEALTETQVIKATVETIAESTSDGVVAPMFYMGIGGAVALYAYKAVNTMDSMIGYKNDRYLYFGRFAAKLDDILNYLPARLAALFMIAASFLLNYDYKNAIKIHKRDKHNHSSPNSAQTESVCAGALGIQLAGNAYYFGKLHEKPTIGDNINEITHDDIIKANRLMYMTSFVAALGLMTIRFLIVLILR